MRFTPTYCKCNVGFIMFHLSYFFLFYHFRPSHHLYLFIYFISGFIVVRLSVKIGSKK